MKKYARPSLDTAGAVNELNGLLAAVRGERQTSAHSFRGEYTEIR